MNASGSTPNGFLRLRRFALALPILVIFLMPNLVGYVQAQSPTPTGTPVTDQSTMAGMAGMDTPTPSAASEVTATLAATGPISASLSATITPTVDHAAMHAMATVEPATDQSNMAGMAGMDAATPSAAREVTASLTATVPVAASPSMTMTSSAAAPAPMTAAQPSDATDIMAETHDVYSLMQSLRQTMQVLLRKPPTNEEIAAIQAQMNVVVGRMAKLRARLQATDAMPVAAIATPSAPAAAIGATAPMAGSPSASNGSVLEQASALLTKIQQAMGALQTILADPTTDAATLARAQVMMSQLSSMVTEVQNLLGPASASGQMSAPPVSVPPTTPPPTTTMTGTATIAQGSAQWVSPASGGSAAGQADGMMAMMSSMMSDMASMMGGMGGMGGSAGGSMSNAASTSAGVQSPSLTPANANNPLARQAEANGVTVTAAPTNLRMPGAATFDFYVSLQTHSVDLSQDLTKLAILRTPSGAEVAATTWLGPSGGHHVEGTLAFPTADSTGAPVIAQTGTLTLILRNLGGVDERVFTWDLSQAP